MQITGISSYSINQAKQSVVIESSLPISKLQEILESDGNKAVVLGLGSKSSRSEAAVAMLGGAVGAGSIMGVVRFVQVGFGILAFSLLFHNNIYF